jgi:hypothetical protein
MNDRSYSYWENFEAPADFSTTHSTIDFTPPQSNISAEGSYSPAEASSQSGSSIHTSDSSFQTHIHRNQTNLITQQPNTSTPYTVIPSNLAHHTISKPNQPPQRGMTNPLRTIFDGGRLCLHKGELPRGAIGKRKKLENNLTDLEHPL